MKTKFSGLSSLEAQKRLAIYGPNKLYGREISPLQILTRQFKSPFIYLLLAAAGLSFVLGEKIDAGFILLFVAINTSLGFYQEYKSEDAVALLKKYVVSHVKIRRNGKTSRVNSEEIVPGDLVILAPGDIIPGDLMLIKCNNLKVDESVLTGESVPVEKKSGGRGFSGTTIVSGNGRGVVFKTGSASQIGQIARKTSETTHESSFEKELSKFSKFILKIILITLLFVYLANLAIKGKSVNHVELIVFAIALAVSVIPEALPAVTTFSLSRGALRLAKNKVVVRRLSAIEDLGGIEVLATDKTGTLTENELKVNEIRANDRKICLIYQVLTSESSKTDPFDIALFNALTEDQKEERKDYKILERFPFDPELRRNSAKIKYKGLSFFIFRGAPEAIVDICKNVNVNERKKIRRWLTKKGLEGSRTLGVAAGFDEKNLNLVGLISFSDSIKATAHQAVEDAEKLGLKIKILTGDAKEVAGSVAKSIGLISSINEVITGEELDKLGSQVLHEAIENYSVFARVSPTQKFKIIKILQESYEVGFLGEGINDAPALKLANISIVVQGAADVAREASDIVLLNKSLKVIVDGIKEGREIFANTTKYIKATLSSNFGNFYAVSVASLLINYLPMLPLQILLVNLLSDFPMIAIAADNTDHGDLTTPKRYETREIALVATVLGIVSSVFDFIFFAIFKNISPEVLQTSWFIGSILTELVFLFSIRTKIFFLKASRPATIIILLTIVASLITLSLPFTNVGRQVFGFTKLSANYMAIILSLVVIYFTVTESVKVFYYKFVKK